MAVDGFLTHLFFLTEEVNYYYTGARNITLIAITKIIAFLFNDANIAKALFTEDIQFLSLQEFLQGDKERWR